ncbi:MAG: gliding motility-associated C-terminal domain-containing protein [Saprospiraceae bacterium]
MSNLSAKISINDLSKDAIKWLYNFGEGEFSILTEPIYEYKDTGIYTIYQKVTNQFGCIDTAFAIVDVKPIYTIFLPNAFIAGSNSINGSYGAVGIPFGLREFEMRIYDRWGNEVFHSNDFNQKWDGNNSDGQPAANGVYAVLVRLTGARGATETIRGQAVLLK